MRVKIIAIAAILGLQGCASSPDVVYSYYPARATTAVLVTETVECLITSNNGNERRDIKRTYGPTVVTTYASNRTMTPHKLETAKLKSALADDDISFVWYDDGRLKSVNRTSVGQGEAIIKAAMTFLAPIIGGAAPAVDACKHVQTLGGGKPVALVYETTIDHTKADTRFPLTVQRNSQATYDALKAIALPMPEIAATLDAPTNLTPLVTVDPPADAIPLTLNTIATMPLKVRVDQVPYWEGNVLVPTNDTYTLPIPKPKLFGTQKFSLTLNEAGAIVSMGYADTASAGGALNALNSVAAVVDPTDKAKAEALKAQADVIAQTQRLAACQAKPEECK